MICADGFAVGVVLAVGVLVGALGTALIAAWRLTDAPTPTSADGAGAQLEQLAALVAAEARANETPLETVARIIGVGWNAPAIDPDAETV